MFGELLNNVIFIYEIKREYGCKYNVIIIAACTVFIHIRAGLKYMQGLKYTPGSAAEWMK